MKKKNNLVIVIFASVGLLACNNGVGQNKDEKITQEDSTIQKKENMLEKINKISVTPLPIGLEQLDNIKQLDYNDFGMKNVPINYTIDTLNKYGLNNILLPPYALSSYDSNLKNMGASITSVDSIKVYFSKRLPPKNNYNFLLCKVVQYVGLGDPFIGWILFVIDDQEVSQYIQVAQSRTVQETLSYTLFNIDKDLKIKTNIYTTSYDTPPYNIAYLSGKQTYVFSTEEGIFKLEKEGYIEEDGKFVELNKDEDILD